MPIIENGTKSETFNIANPFVLTNIHEYMLLINKYEFISEFGTESMDEYDIPEQLRNFRRYDAFKRLISKLCGLVSNTRFKVKDKDSFDKYTIQLKYLSEQTEVIFDRVLDQTSSSENIYIYEDRFIIFLEQFRIIKSEIYSILNKEGLIFKQIESFTKPQIIEDFLERG